MALKAARNGPPTRMQMCLRVGQNLFEVVAARLKNGTFKTGSKLMRAMWKQNLFGVT